VGRAADRRGGQAARHGVTREELLKFYEGKIAKWQVPDDVVFVDAIPLGATGKMLKTRLRETA
jgi:acyl-CoA synthetase (AMP-forming)/AMP-acid ligase II